MPVLEVEVFLDNFTMKLDLQFTSDVIKLKGKGVVSRDIEQTREEA